MSEWIPVPIGDLFEVQNGYAFKSGDFVDNCDTCLEVLKMGHIEKGGGLRKEPKKSYIPRRDELKKWILDIDDIVMAMTDMKDNVVILGVPAKIDRNNHYVLNQRVARLKLKRTDIAEINFLYSYFKWQDFILELQSKANSGVQVNLTTAAIRESVVLLPPLPEQKAIASVLSSLDDKIDLLHRQNKTLEAMAETIFRQWFVEEAQEDWEGGTIADLIEFNPARKLAKGTIAPYLEMAALSTTTFSPDGWYDREFSSGTKFINGDTLLARITPCLENGKAAFVTFLEQDQIGWGSTEYVVMRPKKSLHPFFAYTLCRNRDFRDYAEGCLEGSSGRQRVNVDHLKNYDLKTPPPDVIRNFNEVAESTVQKLHANSSQIRVLEKLRDTLLPKLMSGEVRVAQGGRDMERIQGRVQRAPTVGGET